MFVHIFVSHTASFWCRLTCQNHIPALFSEQYSISLMYECVHMCECVCVQAQVCVNFCTRNDLRYNLRYHLRNFSRNCSLYRPEAHQLGLTCLAGKPPGSSCFCLRSARTCHNTWYFPVFSGWNSVPPVCKESICQLNCSPNHYCLNSEWVVGANTWRHYFQWGMLEEWTRHTT